MPQRYILGAGTGRTAMWWQWKSGSCAFWGSLQGPAAALCPAQTSWLLQRFSLGGGSVVCTAGRSQGGRPYPVYSVMTSILLSSCLSMFYCCGSMFCCCGFIQSDFSIVYACFTVHQLWLMLYLASDVVLATYNHKCFGQSLVLKNYAM
jgi:hypothetical protein